MSGNEIFWTREHCFRALYAWVRLHGRVPSENTDWHSAGPNYPSGRTIVRHFGSWSGFIRTAGFEPLTAGGKKVWTRDLVADWMLDRYLSTGAWPTVPEMRVASPTRRPSYCTVTRLFGSFTAAKRAAGWSAECRHCGKSLGADARSTSLWCSSACRNRARAGAMTVWVAAATCSGCGRHIDGDDRTIGCDVCWWRTRNRDQRAAEKNGVPLGVVESPLTPGDSDPADGNAARRPVHHVTEKAA